MIYDLQIHKGSSRSSHQSFVSVGEKRSAKRGLERIVALSLALTLGTASAMADETAVAAVANGAVTTAAVTAGAAATAASSPSAVQPAPSVGTVRLPSPELETLPNGMRVAWFVDQKLPIIDLGLLFLNGTKSDPAGKSGLTLLTGQMLERGAAGKSNVEFSRAFERLGGNFSVNIDEDGTSLSIHGLSQDAGTYFELLADALLAPNFDANELAKVKAQELDRWEHLGDSADGLASFAFARWMTANSPYARGNIDSLREWKKLKREDVLNHYREKFLPEDAIFMVVGRVNKEEFRQKILSRFGAWRSAAKTGTPTSSAKGTANAKSKSTSMPVGANAKTKFIPSHWRAPRTKILVVNRPGVPQAQVRFGFPIPSIYSKNRYALTVGNALLGEYFNSRLNLVIRDELGLAYGIGSSLNYARELSYLGISSATAVQHVPVLIREVNRILESFNKGLIFKEEIVTAKEYLMGGYPMSVSTLGAVAGRWLAGVVYQLGPDFLNEYLPAVEKVDHAQVLAAVREAFHLKETRIVISGDAKKIVPLLKKFKFTSVEVMEPKQLVQF